MNSIIYITASLLIISKYFDCYTTSSQIISVEHEQNPIARKIMNKLGIYTSIWLIFAITIIIVGISLYLVLCVYDGIVSKIFFIIGGLFVSLVQFAVAHTNKTKRLNIFTKFLLTKLQSWFKK